MVPLTVLLWALIVASASYISTCVIRTLCQDLSRRWPTLGRLLSCKPLSCDVCMSFWAAIPWTGALWLWSLPDWRTVLFVQVAGAGLALRGMRK